MDDNFWLNASRMHKCPDQHSRAGVVQKNARISKYGKMEKRDFNEFDSNRTASYFSGGNMGVQKQGQKKYLLTVYTQTNIKNFKEQKTESVGKKIQFFYLHFHFVFVLQNSELKV